MIELANNHDLGFLFEKPNSLEKRWRGVNFNIELLKKINMTVININDSYKRIFNRIFDVKPSLTSFKNKIDQFLKDYELSYLPSPKIKDKFDLYEPDYTFYLNNKGYNLFFTDYINRNDSDIGKRDNFIKQYNKIIRNEIDNTDNGFFINSIFKEFYLRLQSIYDFTIISENTSIKISENFEKIKSSIKNVIDEFEYLKLFLYNENYKYITTIDTIYDYIKVYAYKVLLGFYYVILFILLINIWFLYIFVNKKILWIRFIHYFVCMLFFALAIISLTVGALFKIMGVAFYDSVGVGQFLFSEQNLLVDKVFVDTTENAHILKSCIHDKGDLANIVFSLNVNCLYLENFYKDSFIIDKLTANLINGGNLEKLKNNSAFSEIYFTNSNRKGSSNLIQSNQTISTNNVTIDNSLKFFNKTISDGLVNSTNLYIDNPNIDKKKSLQVYNYLSLLELSKKNYSYLGESDLSLAFKDSLSNLKKLTDFSVKDSYQKNCVRQTQDNWIFHKNYCSNDYNYIDKSNKNTVFSKQCFTINQWSLLEVRNKYRFSPNECQVDKTNKEMLDEYFSYNQAISKHFDKIKKTIDKNDILIDDISMIMDSINEEFKQIYDYLITNIKSLKPLYSDIQKLMYPLVNNGSIFSFMNCSFVKNDLNYLLWEMEEETSFIFTDVGGYFIATAICLSILIFFMNIVIFRYTVFPPRINFFIDEDEYEEMKLIDDKKEYGNTRIDKEDMVKVKKEINGAEVDEKIDDKIKKILNKKNFVQEPDKISNKDISDEQKVKIEIVESNSTEVLKISEVDDEFEMKIIPNQGYDEKDLIIHKKNKSTFIPSLKILPQNDRIKETIDVNNKHTNDIENDENSVSLIESFHNPSELVLNKHKKNNEININVRNQNKFKSEGSKIYKITNKENETIVTESVNNESIIEGFNPNYIVNSSKPTNLIISNQLIENNEKNESKNIEEQMYQEDKNNFIKELYDNKSFLNRRYSDSFVSEKYNDTIESVQNNIGKKITNIVSIDIPKKYIEQAPEIKKNSNNFKENNYIDSKEDEIEDSLILMNKNKIENQFQFNNNNDNNNIQNTIKYTEQDSKVEETNSDLKLSYQENLKASKVNMKKANKNEKDDLIDAPKFLLIEGEKTLNYNPKKKIIQNPIKNQNKNNDEKQLQDLKPDIKVNKLEENENIPKYNKHPNMKLENDDKKTKDHKEDNIDEEDEYEEYEEEIEYDSEELVEE